MATPSGCAINEVWLGDGFLRHQDDTIALLTSSPVAPTTRETISFAQRLEPSEVVGTRAWGRVYPGSSRANVTSLIVQGLRHLPDPAEQMHLIARGISVLPDDAHLHDERIIGTDADLFEFLEMAQSVYDDSVR